MRFRFYLLITVAVLALEPACSIRKYAINKIGDALASGSSVYENDEDIELVGDALPFGLKLAESLLSESPNHRGLLLTACRGFVLYSYAYVHFEADKVTPEDLDRGNALRTRAGKLYLRALDYGLRGLERSYSAFGEKLASDPKAAINPIKAKDLPLLYWTTAALGLAISANRSDAEMLARLPEVEAMIDRAFELNEAWEEGTLHEFQIVFSGAKPSGQDYDAIRKHYERALELSQGKRAGVYLAYAEAVSVPSQNRSEFRSLLEKALAVDPDQRPETRLANLIAHRRARWLLGRIDELFLEEEPNQLTGENG